MDECGGAVPGTAVFSAFTRRHANQQQQLARGSANHPGGTYDLFSV